MRSKSQWVATAAAMATWVVAAIAHAQGAVGGGIGGDEIAERDWMASGLAPLVLLLGLGIAIALFAAAIATISIRSSKRRFGDPNAT